MFDLDLLDLNGYSDTLAQSTSPYSIDAKGLDMAGAERKYQWADSDYSPGATQIGGAPMQMVERTVPIFVRARFPTAFTNLLTNPRPYSVVTGWAASGVGSTVTFQTVETEPVIRAVTTGTANAGMEFSFTATVAAYSAGVWVKLSSGTGSIDVKFDSSAATNITATTSWQFVKSENITLSAAARTLQIRQTTAVSQTIYVKLAGAGLGATYPGYVDGACGDGIWNGAAHSSTSTSRTSQDAVSKAFGLLGEKGSKAIATAATGGLTLYWQPKNSAYRSTISCRAVDVSKIDYNTSHAGYQVAAAEVKLICHPYREGPEYLAGTASKVIGTHALTFDITNVKGDVPGRCRVVVTDQSSKDFRFCTYGIQARDYVAGSSLILGAASFGVSGYSGTLTAATTGVQTLTRTGTISGGTFTLTYDGQTTTALQFNDTAATVQTALRALTTIGGSNITVAGGPISTTTFTFTWAANLASQTIQPMTVTSSLTGGGTVAMATTTAGSPAYVSAGLYSSWTTIHDTGNLTHVGAYEVWARVYDNAVSTDLYKASLQFDYGTGDLASTASAGDPVTPQACSNASATTVVGGYSRVYLGVIDIPVVPTGTQRWAGRLKAKTSGTSGNTLRVIDLEFKPLEMGAGEVRAVDSTATSLVAVDSFSAISGVMNGDSATLGGIYARSGDADDFSAGGGGVQRAAVSDAAAVGCYELLTVAHTGVDASIEMQINNAVGGSPYLGLCLRYSGPNDYLLAVVNVSTSTRVVQLIKCVAGTRTVIGSVAY